MNTFKKIYCRIFQTCFRIALPFLPYREPELKTSHFPHPARHRSGCLQAWTYKTFGKTAFKISDFMYNI